MLPFDEERNGCNRFAGKGTLATDYIPIFCPTGFEGAMQAATILAAFEHDYTYHQEGFEEGRQATFEGYTAHQSVFVLVGSNCFCQIKKIKS